MVFNAPFNNISTIILLGAFISNRESFFSLSRDAINKYTNTKVYILLFYRS